MLGPVSLKDAEQQVFRRAYDDGLWDFMIAAVLSMLTFAPYLSVYMGDFWSSAVFVPVILGVFGLVWFLRRKVVRPRVGSVNMGAGRVKKLKWLTTVMLVINLVALGLGIVAAVNFGRMSGYMMAMMLGIILLVGFSLAGYLLGFFRLYLYGLMVVGGPLLGEWLWQKGLVSHHGYPVVFGTISLTMVIWGGSVFLEILRNNPLPENAGGPEQD